MNVTYPQAFSAAGWHIGIKQEEPTALDFGVIHSELPCSSAALFTRNNLPGWPVVVGRKHTKHGKFRTVIVNSGNANVATKREEGLSLVYDCCKRAAKSLSIDVEEILPASTGVIGRPLHIFKDKMYQACDLIPEKIKQPSFDDFARAICTTDAFIKTKHIQLSSGIRISGFAKGAGMIEPNMATMLGFICTDAKMDKPTAQLLLKAACDRSFNRISVDSDTSTSDTAALLANGASEIQVHFNSEMAQKLAQLSYPLQKNDIAEIKGIDQNTLEFIQGLLHVCVSLACMIVKDGEGATKVIELHVQRARDSKQALKIGRSILNSPLCKTAIYGCDPNWGRIIMAIGKVFDEPIVIEDLKVYFGDLCFSPYDAETPANINHITNYLKNEKVVMKVDLGQGNAKETLWGCDLNENYVRLNSEYTT